ncbi:hydroxymethylglutaryl-CoA lyase [Sporomusa malonica]|uniref:Hydroxymethylglutaryl-CoA lyase n=1 Tax=Sporomusa malonica TaxID=112901 RepID=A0A1W1YB25_9FIRM|nr:hydroxymethylglutaryl-CoA lyase [Sporomusa malonica]SMC33001.1 hydroxymethylglutaryl-CoA lyase [Sporomusa malonica]
MHLPKQVEITEVGPRDGFQNIKEWIPTETKLEIIDHLAACGFKKMEVTAFVHPKAVPQMADAKEIITAVKAKHKDVVWMALTPNLKGVTNAIEAGADQVGYIISASDRHNFANTKQTIDQSLEGLGEVCKIKGDTKIQLSIPTVFNCPWGGRVPAENVIKIIEYGLSVGVDDIGLADTVGSAHPLQVKELLDIVKAKFPELNLVLHLHDTNGMAMASIFAALQAGTTRFETAVGGLGGCPFAPGAAGNVATEDLVNMLEGMGISTGIDFDKLMKAAYKVQELLPVPISSRMSSAIACKTHME